MSILFPYTLKRWLRLWDSRWTQRTQEIIFRDRSFEFYSTYFWNDASQAVFDVEIAPYFAILEKDFRPEVIIDVGAATGHFAIIAAILFPGSTVYAFEPSERQRTLLTRNASLNGVTNIKIQPLGLWKCSDHLSFRTNGAESSFESVSRFQGRLPFLEKVPVTTLDQWAGENQVSTIDLIKMDAEGAEVEILHGAQDILRRGNSVLLTQAYHLRGGVRTLETCADILEGYQYETREADTQDGLLYARKPRAMPSTGSVAL